ncbi:olfactory receptor 3-like [Python bivittatus]|uniref:Olfactory receptor n=1 Tax=Python bivittatus TaxID=176946 RepID=A0A9F2WF24_PYTBI|nr:olfactory receptor 3-like [Python bivittatus]
MGFKNKTAIMDFVLRGFSIQPQYEGPLFSLFLFMYLLTFLGNSLIILLILFDAHLCGLPMYFFLIQLSLVDICFSSATTPKMLEILLSKNKTISYTECLLQLYLLITLANVDGFLLGSMAYDRYVAICFPLNYVAIMTRKRCLELVAGSWLLPCLHSLLHTLLMSQHSFCGSLEISHFFCDIRELLSLSCSDVSIHQMIIFIEGASVTLSPLVCILLSYVQILSNILKIPNAQGKYKAFSTCGSHILSVAFYFGSIMGVYFQPSSPERSTSVGTFIASVIFMVITPMLNPVIYSLKNNEVRNAMKRVCRKMKKKHWV